METEQNLKTAVQLTQQDATSKTAGVICTTSTLTTGKSTTSTISRKKDLQKPIIFLDFDGVINSIDFAQKKIDKQISRTELDTRAIGWLNELIEKTGAKVVVSSTWRLGRTVEELQDLLNKHGFKGEVIGTTLDLRFGKHSDSILRGNEILQWIKDHPFEIGANYYSDYDRYVIFDDDSDMLYWQKDNFIQTDGYFGLSPMDCYRARKILGSVNSMESPY